MISRLDYSRGGDGNNGGRNECRRAVTGESMHEVIGKGLIGDYSRQSREEWLSEISARNCQAVVGTRSPSYPYEIPFDFKDRMPGLGFWDKQRNEAREKN
jgi:hypothetical protein